MIEQWEEFPIGPNDRSERLHVTLSRKGEILIGGAAFERFGTPDGVVLLFDTANGRIGLLPRNPLTSSKAYPLKKKGRHRHRTISASRFCRHYNIRVDSLIAFDAPTINKDGILILDPKKTTTIGRPSLKK